MKRKVSVQGTRPTGVARLYTKIMTSEIRNTVQKENDYGTNNNHGCGSSSSIKPIPNLPGRNDNGTDSKKKEHVIVIVVMKGFQWTADKLHIIPHSITISNMPSMEHIIENMQQDLCSGDKAYNNLFFFLFNREPTKIAFGNLGIGTER